MCKNLKQIETNFSLHLKAKYKTDAECTSSYCIYSYLLYRTIHYSWGLVVTSVYNYDKYHPLANFIICGKHCSTFCHHMLTIPI